MFFNKKGQAAIEFLMIVGVALTMILPAVFVFQQFSSQASEQVISSQINSFGREILNSIEAMYYYGEFSKTTLRFNFPDNVIDVTINPATKEGDYYELVVKAYAYGDYTDFVFFSRIPIANETDLKKGEPEYQYYSDLDADLEPRSESFAAGLKTFRVESIKKNDRLWTKINRIIIQ